MNMSDFWTRSAATVLVIAMAIGFVIALVTQAAPPPMFFYVAGVPLGFCMLFAVIAGIWE